MRIQYWLDSNLATKRGRGNNIDIFPFFKIFFPWPSKTSLGRNTTIHFGWLFWTLGIHFYHNQPFSISCQEWHWTKA